MREHSIILNQREVLALLDNRLTQIRRVVKQPYIPHITEPETYNIFPDMKYCAVAQVDPRYGFCVFGATERECAEKLRNANGPLGTVGDRLYVRETLTVCGDSGIVGYAADDAELFNPNTMPHNERAVDLIETWGDYYQGYEMKVPSGAMPRWASRLTLENISIRVERVQGITEEDAIACGVHLLGIPTEEERSWKRIPTFRTLWDMQNRKHPWESNPWVFVVNVKRINEKG